METFIDVYLDVDGEKISIIFEKLTELGLKHHIGDHDFIYDWKKAAPISEELALFDKIQEKIKGTGTILKFTTIR